MTFKCMEAISTPQFTQIAVDLINFRLIKIVKSSTRNL